MLSKLRAKQKGPGLAVLENKIILRIFSTLGGKDFQSKKWPQGKDHIKSVAMWSFVKILERFKAGPSWFSQVDNIDSKNLKNILPQQGDIYKMEKNLPQKELWMWL